MAVRKVMGNKKAAARPTAGLRNESKQSNIAVARAHAQQVQQRSANGKKGLAGSNRAGSKSNNASTKSSTVGNSSLLKPQTNNALRKRATAREAQHRRKMGR